MGQYIETLYKLCIWTDEWFHLFFIIIYISSESLYAWASHSRNEGFGKVDNPIDGGI